MLNKAEPTLEQMQMALRANVCMHCFRRPCGSETLASDQPRACEQNCQIFRVLPRMRELAYLDPMVADFRHAAEKVFCETCRGQKAGCDQNGDCIVKRYRQKVLSTLQELMNHTRG